MNDLVVLYEHWEWQKPLFFGADESRRRLGPENEALSIPIAPGRTALFY
jgi:hypothetical protein